ncbi:hypothetical protein GCM10025883_12680 [Mobilicoccus caccae]|uniref:Ribosomal protein uS12 methylthiotransferase RimO n=1 Tax=Mobilicoccus caccae TaxID=1859295 RepID=A0ABQ6IPP2_9MICO|nr:hypothetical protein GCM10025883_12680 [Mobilicoccus caccae]
MAENEVHGSVAIVTLGCARNDVDSEELAGRLRAGGWRLVEEPGEADVAVVNTCGFVEQAKKDSIDALLETADLKEHGRTQKVVAVGCLAERYGEQLAAELPEADAVLGFDSYTDMSGQLRAILDGAEPASHVPRDRRTLLPLAPTQRPAAVGDVVVPGVWMDQIPRARLGDAPWAPLKIASGCDRRCAFCAIPAFRGSFVSRRPTDVVAEARWLADNGVREALLVSENSTSYGKDLGDLRLLESLLPELAAIDGLDRVRVSYLQPAEIRPGLLEVMAQTPGVVPYFDLSFQHASPTLLRRMRRFGGREDFLGLVERIRDLVPEAGIRSNVIVGFPGETEEDVEILRSFLADARMDVVGVFGYSDEDGTEALGLEDKLPEDVIAGRVSEVTDLVEELMSQRAADRVGSEVSVLVEGVEDEDEGERGVTVGRADHQGPEVDGVCRLTWDPAIGDLVTGRVVESDGVDLVVEPLGGRGEHSRRQAEQLEPPERADGAEDPPGPAVPVAVAPARRPRRRRPLVGVRRVRRRDDHRSTRRRTGPAQGAHHRLRQDGRPDRRQGADRGRVHRAVAHRPVVVVGDDRRPRARDRHHPHAVRRHPLRRHARRQGGKLKTVLQAVALALFIAPLGGVFFWAASAVMGAAVVVTAVTGIDYVLAARRLVAAGRPA